MQLVTRLEAFSPRPERPLIVLLGNFDGLHLGHQSLVKWGLGEALQTKGAAAVFTFSTHPQQVLHGGQGPQLLTSLDHKLFLLGQSGVELCFLLPFTQEFARMEAEDFVENILVKRLHVSQVGMGYNARFGHGRKGDSALMEKSAAKLGFRFFKAEAVKADGEYVSSSRIRALITEGKLEEAEHCLGRHFSFFGRVVKGSGRGAKLGIPTANFDLASQALPPFGVYPVRARGIRRESRALGEGFEEVRLMARQQWFGGVMNYGKRPTFQASGPAVAEAHFFDFSGDLLGQMLEIEIYPKLREEKAFENPEALKRQIEEDKQKARKTLALTK